MSVSARTAPGRITHRVGHSSWEGEATRTSEVFNPATGEVSAQLALASEDDVNAVVGAAAAGGVAGVVCAGTAAVGAPAVGAAVCAMTVNGDTTAAPKAMIATELLNFVSMNAVLS